MRSAAHAVPHSGSPGRAKDTPATGPNFDGTPDRTKLKPQRIIQNKGVPSWQRPMKQPTVARHQPPVVTESTFHEERQTSTASIGNSAPSNGEHHNSDEPSDTDFRPDPPPAVGPARVVARNKQQQASWQRPVFAKPVARTSAASKLAQGCRMELDPEEKPLNMANGTKGTVPESRASPIGVAAGLGVDAAKDPPRCPSITASKLAQGCRVEQPEPDQPAAADLEVDCMAPGLESVPLNAGPAGPSPKAQGNCECATPRARPSTIFPQSCDSQDGLCATPERFESGDQSVSMSDVKALPPGTSLPDTERREWPAWRFKSDESSTDETGAADGAEASGGSKGPPCSNDTPDANDGANGCPHDIGSAPIIKDPPRGSVTNNRPLRTRFPSWQQRPVRHRRSEDQVAVTAEGDAWRKEGEHTNQMVEATDGKSVEAVEWKVADDTDLARQGTRGPTSLTLLERRRSSLCKGKKFKSWEQRPEVAIGGFFSAFQSQIPTRPMATAPKAAQS